MAKKWFVLLKLSFFKNYDRFSLFQAQNYRTIIVLSYIWQHWDVPTLALVFPHCRHIIAFTQRCIRLILGILNIYWLIITLL